MHSNRALQHWYPWVVIGIAFLTVGVAFGARNAFALFLIEVVEEFAWSRAITSGALMLGSVVWTISAPFIGTLLDRVGPRIVLSGGAIIMGLGFVISGVAQSVTGFYVGMGIFMGLGFAALPMTSQATFLSNWFKRRRGMAIGIVASGIGAGIFLVVPFTQKLIDAYGWRTACFVLAVLLVGVVAPLNCFFQRRRPEEMNLEADFGEPPTVEPLDPIKKHATTGPSLKEALRSLAFWQFATGVFAGAIPLHMLLIHQVAAVYEAGFSRESAAFTLGLVGFFTMPSMILMGILGDRIGRQKSYIIGSTSLMISIALLMVIDNSARSWVVYMFPVFFAFGFSSRQSLYPAIAADLFHGSSFGAIIGTIALFIGAGAGVGPWLGGLLRDWSGGYGGAFWTAQAMSVASMTFIWMAATRKNLPIEPGA